MSLTIKQKEHIESLSSKGIRHLWHDPEYQDSWEKVVSYYLSLEDHLTYTRIVYEKGNSSSPEHLLAEKLSLDHYVPPLKHLKNVKKILCHGGVDLNLLVGYPYYLRKVGSITLGSVENLKNFFRSYLLKQITKKLAITHYQTVGTLGRFPYLLENLNSELEHIELQKSEEAYSLSSQIRYYLPNVKIEIK